MAQLILFNKPFQVLCQFSTSDDRKTLKHYLSTPECEGFYPAGRLDYDSEGLLVLTNDGALQQRIAHPEFKMPKTYWVQVEGNPDSAAMETLRRGVALPDGQTRPAKVSSAAPPPFWPRNPPVRERAKIPTQWLKIVLQEGRNRQVRRMTAAVGHPTLRLIRTQIGPWALETMAPGDFRSELVHLPNNSKPVRSKRR